MESESENQNENVDEQEQPEIEPPAEQKTDDDVVEVEMSNASAMSKRRLSADFWKEFNMLPPGPDKKQWCSCKRCGATYACPSTYGTGTSTQRRGGLNMCENIFANEAEDVMKTYSRIHPIHPRRD
ncbi:uncharacterized protein LOC108214138 isoform X2 [Daucus carota subsp. sativus]|uniref:uncharacterized protein LOC108214138 isoform X2 n=1 Tax=Daucus carota subsp. sativus TaxID=79200 RepID=UPI003083808E